MPLFVYTSVPFAITSGLDACLGVLTAYLHDSWATLRYIAVSLSAGQVEKKSLVILKT